MGFHATRRRFVSLLALSPLAGKAAADEAIAKLTLTKLDGTSGVGMAGMPSGSTGLPTAELPKTYDPNTAVATYVKTCGLPAWQDRAFRDQAYYVSALDPDIACKRSWSMSVKIVTQRQRNYERLVAEIETRAIRSTGKRALEKLLGGYINWY